MIHLLVALALATALTFGVPPSSHGTHAGHAVTSLDCTSDGTCNGVYSSGGPPG
ncbi:MAG TPA: hypothetical protein VHT53_04850 [Candidatus Elarobacter sp.]|nr:hypothetical protein [Candidatus Elarobacter sp.]